MRNEDNALFVIAALICLAAWAAWRSAVHWVAGIFGADPDVTGPAIGHIFWLFVMASVAMWLLRQVFPFALSLTLAGMSFLMGAVAFWRPVIDSAASAYVTAHPNIAGYDLGADSAQWPWWDSWWAFWGVEGVLFCLLAYLVGRIFKGYRVSGYSY